MNAYAQIKGRVAQPKVTPRNGKADQDEELSDQEIERIAKNRDFIKKHMPELVEFIKELHAAGLIDGWRSVKKCALFKEKK